MIIILSGFFVYGMSVWFLWYRYESNSSFHFFDDSLEWGGMDKMGHIFSSFVLVSVIHEILQLVDSDKIKTLIFSVLLTFLLMMSIEFLDGFCDGYGASYFDAIANVTGIGFAIIWIIILKRKNGILKLSYFDTWYTLIRPNMLGDTLAGKIIKDYNGEAFWICISPYFWHKSLHWWPKWLNIAIGYGIDGYLGGHDNIWKEGNDIINYSHINRSSSVYVSLDINLELIPYKINNKWILTLIRIINFTKIPLPIWEVWKW
ncbi:MAG: DUF2279 domain-containing protein [Bacteroidota bacterium]|nr:DUF2279 domain-containing protein [Bacteroidota bacterium]